MPGKRRRVLWAPKSKQDLLEVWRYFARVASPDIADRLLREIEQAGERLADQALMGRARDEVMKGLRAVLVNPYTVFHRVTDHTVEIVRVLHERRNVGEVIKREQ